MTPETFIPTLVLCVIAGIVIGIIDDRQRRRRWEHAPEGWGGIVHLAPRSIDKEDQRRALRDEILEFARLGGKWIILEFSECRPIFEGDPYRTLVDLIERAEREKTWKLVGVCRPGAMRHAITFEPMVATGYMFDDRDEAQRYVDKWAEGWFTLDG